MTSIQKPVGKITLRDFKALFDRPGFYRYHFKTMDKEFGMVKEEVRDREGTMREFLKCDQVKHPAILPCKLITLGWTGLETGNYHFKTFSFQIGEDDKTLPGVEGKIVVWVEEE